MPLAYHSDKNNRLPLACRAAAQPAAGHETMAIGLRAITPERGRRLGTILADPFRSAVNEPGVTGGPRRRDDLKRSA